MGLSPQLSIPPDPITPEEQPRDPRQDRGNLFSRIVLDPRILNFLLSFGSNLSQPRRVGQSELQGFSEAILSGFQGIELARAAQAERERLEREERREAIATRNQAIKTQAEVEGTRAETGVTRTEGEIKEEDLEEQRRTQEATIEAAQLEPERVRTEIDRAEQARRTSGAQEELARASARKVDKEIEQLPIRTEILRRNVALAERKLENAIQRGAADAELDEIRLEVERATLQLAREKLQAAKSISDNADDPVLKEAFEAEERVLESEITNIGKLRESTSAAFGTGPAPEDIETVRKANREADTKGEKARLDVLLSRGFTRTVSPFADALGGIRSTNKRARSLTRPGETVPVFVGRRIVTERPVLSSPHKLREISREQAVELGIPLVDSNEETITVLEVQTENGVIFNRVQF